MKDRLIQLRKWLLPLLLCLLFALGLGFFFRPLPKGVELTEVWNVHLRYSYELEETAEIEAFLDELASLRVGRCLFPKARRGMGISQGESYDIRFLGSELPMLSSGPYGRQLLLRVDGKYYRILEPPDFADFLLEEKRTEDWPTEG